MFNYICILEQVEDAQAREAPVQRLADSIAGPFVYTVMTLAAATFSFWCALVFFSFYKGCHASPGPLCVHNNLFLRKQELILIKCQHYSHAGYLGEYIQEFHTTKYALNMKSRHT